MPKAPPHHAAHEPPEERRDADGLLIDEYSDESLSREHTLDALDIPAALAGEEALAEVADMGEGIESIDLAPQGERADTIDSGARHAIVDDGEMGLGAEPHSAEELALAAIGDALAGPRGTTRDDEVHGERLLDDPDEAAAEEAEDEAR